MPFEQIGKMMLCFLLLKYQSLRETHTKIALFEIILFLTWDVYPEYIEHSFPGIDGLAQPDIGKLPSIPTHTRALDLGASIFASSNTAVSFFLNTVAPREALTTIVREARVSAIRRD